MDSICTTINGLWKGEKGPLVRVGVIRNANFTKEFTLDYSKIEYIDVELRSFEKRYLDDGDIIVEKSGGSDSFPVGRSILFCGENRKYSFSNFTMSLRIIDKCLVLPKFLYYVLQQKYRRGDMKQMQTQTTGLHNLLSDVFLSMPIPIPPKEEQQRIIDRVDNLFSIVSELDALQRKFTHSVDAAKSKILDLAIHGKLVPQDPSDEPAIELLKRINPDFQPSHNLHYEGATPLGWQIVKMGDVIDIISGTSYQKTDIVSADDGIRVLRGGNIQDGKILLYEDDVFIDSSLANRNNSIHRGDTLIVASTGSSELIGKAAFASKDYQGTQIGAFLRIIRPKLINIAEYLGMLFQTEYYKHHIREVAKGTNINNIKSSYLTEFVIPLPPLEEQGRIIGQVKKLFTILDLISNSVHSSEQALNC